MVLNDGGGDGSCLADRLRKTSNRSNTPFRFKANRGMIAAQEQRQLAEQEQKQPVAAVLPRCYPEETDHLRVARSQGLSECLEITTECAREAVEETAADCVRSVSDFVAGWRFGGDVRGGMGKNDLIPLAVVNAGLHVGDRTAAVEYIRKGVQRGTTTSATADGDDEEACLQVVAVVTSRDCKTVQAALAQISRQCLAVGGTASRRPLFMDSLGEWYTSLFVSPPTRPRAAPPTFPSTSSTSFASPATSSSTSAVASTSTWSSSRKSMSSSTMAFASPSSSTVASTSSMAFASPSSATSTSSVASNAARTSTMRGRGVGGGGGRGGGGGGGGRERVGGEAGFGGKGRAGAEDEGDGEGERGVRGEEEARRKKLKRRRPAVVVLLEDVEGIDKQVLRDLMNVLAQSPRFGNAAANRRGPPAPRIGRAFPLAFVAMASAGVGFPLDRLSPSATRQLSLENFSFPTSRDCADVLYRKLFIQVQRAAMEHFSRPGSYLCLQNCLPWLRRCTVYEDLPEEVLVFMSQKLKRDSFRMPQAELETLLGVSLSMKKGTVAVSVEPNQSGTRVVSRETDQSGTEGGSLEKAQDTGVSRETEQPRAGDPLQTDRSGAAAANKLKHKISTSEARRFIGRALWREATRALRLWFLHKVLNLLNEAFEGRVKFDCGGMRVVELFSMDGRRSRRSYYTQLKEAAESLGSLSPAKVVCLMLDLVRALPTTSTNEAVASIARAKERAPSASLANEGAVSIDGANQGAASAGSTNQEAVWIAGANEGVASATPANQKAMSIGGANEETVSAAPANQGPVSIDGTNEEAPSVVLANREAVSIEAAPRAGSSDRSADRSTDYHARRELLPEGSSERSVEESSVDADRPRAIQGLDGREASYLRLSASRVRTLWAKADAEGWAEQSSGDEEFAISLERDAGGISGTPGTSGAFASGAGAKAAASRGNRLFNSARSQTWAGVSPQGSGAGATQDPTTADAAREGGDPEAVEGEERRGTEESEGGGKRHRALKRACLVRELQLLFLHVMGEARDCPLGPGASDPPPLLMNDSILAQAYCVDNHQALSSALCPLLRERIDGGMLEGASAGVSGLGQKRKGISDARGSITDTCLLYSSYRFYGKVIDRSDWFTDFRQSVADSAPSKNSAASAPVASKGGANSRGKQHPPSANPSQSGKQKKRSKGSKAAGSRAGGGGRGGSGRDWDGAASEEEEVIDPNGKDELRARFKHASDELAFMGYVQPYKRRRKEDVGATGPKGAVTRLVYAYTMQGGVS